MFQSLVSLALALPLVMGADIMVRVGPDNSLLYQPEFVTAKVGDVVKFEFVSKNHTVTQSSFDQPCMFAPGGANTGFVMVAPGQHPLPVKAFTVPHMNPIWFYCAQQPHCSKGMVFAINPGHDGTHNSFTNFKMKAMQQQAPMYPPGHPQYTPPAQHTPPPQHTSSAIVYPSGHPLYTPPAPVYPVGHPLYTPPVVQPAMGHTSSSSMGHTSSSTMGHPSSSSMGHTTSSVMVHPPIVTPPAPTWVPMTATVTWQSSTYTTTYKSYAGSPPPTPAVNPTVHKIVVGDAGQLVYNPTMVSAAIGDTVLFEFRPKNHTVTQSSFLNPCEPLVKPDGSAGFRSGFQAVDASLTTGFPEFRVTINDTEPIYGYCGQASHCAAGMVFGINVVPTDFTTFQNFAKQIGAAQSISPIGTLPSSTDSFGVPPPAPTGAATANSVGRGVWFAVGIVVVGVFGWGL